MNLTQVDSTDTAKTPTSVRPAPLDPVAVRKMAVQFEAVLLNQLTAALNPPADEDNEGDALFTNGGGLGLSRQMFSEQLAKTMSESGGIGLADLIAGQVNKSASAIKGRDGLRTATATRVLKSLRTESATATKTLDKSRSVASDQYPDAIIVSEAGAPSPTVNAAAAITSNTDVVKVSAVSSANPMNTGPVYFRLPVRGAIRSTFGPRRDPINGRPGFHKGVDIAAPRGTPIAAAAAGKVVFSGRNKGFGNMVIIQHSDGRQTVYGHAESLFVKTGDTVADGQTIAAVGSTGHSTGPHVHFEVRENNRPINPMKTLSNGFASARR